MVSGKTCSLKKKVITYTDTQNVNTLSTNGYRGAIIQCYGAGGSNGTPSPWYFSFSVSGGTGGFGSFSQSTINFKNNNVTSLSIVVGAVNQGATGGAGNNAGYGSGGGASYVYHYNGSNYNLTCCGGGGGGGGGYGYSYGTYGNGGANGLNGGSNGNGAGYFYSDGGRIGNGGNGGAGGIVTYPASQGAINGDSGSSMSLTLGSVTIGLGMGGKGANNANGPTYEGPGYTNSGIFGGGGGGGNGFGGGGGGSNSGNSGYWGPGGAGGGSGGSYSLDNLIYPSTNSNTNGKVVITLFI